MHSLSYGSGEPCPLHGWLQISMLSLGASVYDPTDPVGRLLFNVLGMVAEFEADLIRLRTREGMSVVKANGRLRGQTPKLSVSQRRHLLELHDNGEHTHAELAELFSVSRTTINREVQRRAVTAMQPPVNN